MPLPMPIANTVSEIIKTCNTDSCRISIGIAIIVLSSLFDNKINADIRETNYVMSKDMQSMRGSLVEMRKSTQKELKKVNENLEILTIANAETERTVKQHTEQMKKHAKQIEEIKEDIKEIKKKINPTDNPPDDENDNVSQLFPGLLHSKV